MRPQGVGDALLRTPDTLRGVMAEAWPFGDVSVTSHGRVTTFEVIDVLAHLISRARNHTYAHTPDQFAEDIDRLIFIKRTIFLEEMVLD
jgi:hypothetical protein